MRIDELNVVNEQETRILSIEQYFGEMRLPEEEKKKRIDMCEDFEVFLIYIIELGEEYELEVYTRMIQTGLIDIAKEHIDLTQAIINRINEDAQYIAETTKKYIDTPFYTSEDRATLLAENETQAISNISEYENAKEFGFTYKEWLAMPDEKVRETHALVDGEKVPIGTPFIVGDSLMMYPMDASLGASPQEIINCRCSIRYTRNA